MNLCMSRKWFRKLTCLPGLVDLNGIRYTYTHTIGFYISLLINYYGLHIDVQCIDDVKFLVFGYLSAKRITSWEYG